LATLRDTLLPRLISGQLRLPEAEQTVEEEIA
ncbi:MAG: restriction endonuclease subunit S, partial [Betaproteobacteria bacterium]